MASWIARLGSSFVAWLRFLFSKRGIPTWKGTLAYVIAYILAFLYGFDSLLSVPTQVSGLMIIVVLGTPGTPVGICLINAFWNVLGIMLGALDAYILTNLGQVLVAQGVVYFFLVYVFSFAKAISLKYLAFALLGIVWCISSVAATFGNNSEPNIPFIISTLKSYFWGTAIVLFVNLFVLPTSAEEVFRSTMVSALHHMDTFSRLLLQSYSSELTEAEANLRTELAGKLRMETDIMQQMIEGTSVEITWSNWSMPELISQGKTVQRLHETLMGLHADYMSAERAGYAVDVRTRFLQNSLPDIKRLSQAITLTISELSSALAPSGKPMDLRAAIGQMDLERQILPDQPLQGDDTLQTFKRRFAEEMESHDGSTTAGNSAVNVHNTGVDAAAPSRPVQIRHNSGLPPTVHALKDYLDRWTSQQLDIVSHLFMASGFDTRDRPLTLHAPLASIADTFSKDHVADITRGPVSPYTLKIAATTGSVLSDDLEKDVSDTSMIDGPSDRAGQALVRMYSLLFAMNRFAGELQDLHTLIIPSSGGKLRKSLHVHPWEHWFRSNSATPRTVTVPLTEAAQTIGAQVPPKQSRTLWDWFLVAERFLRGPRNVYAFKLTLAIEVLTVLAWAPVVRPWFLSYGLPLSVVTVVLVVTPTFGETYIWALQQLGGVLGYIYGLIVLEIFRNVGGYAFNPYGIVCLIGLWTIPMMYLMHEVPIGFPFGLLAMIFGSIYVCNEYVTVNFLDAPYDSPSYSAGKALTTIAVGIGIAALFQFLILRNPARRTLRKSLVSLLHTNRNYVSLLHAYFRALQTPESDSSASSPAAFASIEQELERREGNIHLQIRNIAPMVGSMFGEPQWDAPFGAEPATKVLEANEILLERLKNARAAMRSEPFHPYLAQNFVSALAPYRRQWNVAVRMALYTSAASLSSETPVPADMLKIPWKFVNDMVLDALCISARMGRSEEGRAMLKTKDFARFWFYLLVVSAATEQVQAIEEACASIYGTDETIF